MRDVIGWNENNIQTNNGKIWRPSALQHNQWPPDYDAVYRWRHKILKELQSDPLKLAAAKTYYKTRPAEFIMDWMDTYDPRREGSKWIPFVFFKRQEEVIDFFEDCRKQRESGLCEKCRDAGLSWIAVGYSSWLFLFGEDIAIGWGSRKDEYVDKLGDPKSIFEKIRQTLRRLPAIWLPRDFNWSKHSKQKTLINPNTGSAITGESGDKIGRGDRTSIYFIDEASHLERQELVEASLGDTTNTRIDISSVNGLGNVFHKRRENGIVWQKGEVIPPGYVRVFIMDWRDHPAKTQEWYDTKKAKYEREGLSHVFAQETDRNYSAAISNTVIPYEWIKAAVDAHKHVTYFANACTPERMSRWYAGLDVADQGEDRNAFMLRQWVIWRHVEEWGERDPGISARRAVIGCRPHAGHIECMYDSIGVGTGVKSEYNRLTADDNIISAELIPFIPWNAGAGVINPYERIIEDDQQSLMNRDFFENLKAQAWWSLRTRFYKTFKAKTEQIIYPVDELISLDSSMPLLDSLMKELAQATFGQSGHLRMKIEKSPGSSKSPNLADSGVMGYYPIPLDTVTAVTGTYGY